MLTMHSLAVSGAPDRTRSTTPYFGCAFSAAELEAIRVGETDLRALRWWTFPMRGREPATPLADDRLEALRAVIVAAGSDYTGVSLLSAYRNAVAAGIHELKLQALIDVYWD